MHRFYRDRLSKVYLFNPVAHTHVDGLRLSELKIAETGAPYHLINTTLNIQGTKDRNMQGRGADFFLFSPRWCGSYQTGYCSTDILERRDPDVNLGTCTAISGASAAPYMGPSTNKMLVFLFTILNIRLDYWLPNPGRLAPSPMKHLVDRTLSWVGPAYLVFELLGWLNAKSKYVNLSDGGHIDNLGLYELFRRRCKYIVCCDAEQDANMILGPCRPGAPRWALKAYST